MENQPELAESLFNADEWLYIETPASTPVVPKVTPQIPQEIPQTVPDAEPAQLPTVTSQGDGPIGPAGFAPPAGPAEAGHTGFTASANLWMAGIVGLGAGALLMRWWCKQASGTAALRSTTPEVLQSEAVPPTTAPPEIKLPSVQEHPELAATTVPSVQSTVLLTMQGASQPQGTWAHSPRAPHELAEGIQPRSTSSHRVHRLPDMGGLPAADKFRQPLLGEENHAIPVAPSPKDERVLAEPLVLLGMACQHFVKDVGSDAEVMQAPEPWEVKVQQSPEVVPVQQRAGTAKQALVAVGVMLAFLLVANHGIMLRRLQNAAPLTGAQPSVAEAQRACRWQLEKVCAIPDIRREQPQPLRHSRPILGAPKRCVGLGQENGQRHSLDPLASVDVNFEIMAAAAGGPRGPIGKQAEVHIVEGIVRPFPQPQCSSSHIFRVLPSH